MRDMDVRFLLDEHIDHTLGTALKLRGHDAITIGEANLLGADDLETILPFAYSNSRVFVTRDVDFLVFYSQGVAHAGIVHWHGKKRNVKEAIHYLLQLARIETAESMAGIVRYVNHKYP